MRRLFLKICPPVFFCVLAATARAVPPVITPTAPPSLQVHVSAGEIPGGKPGTAIKVVAGDVTFDAPELHEFKAASSADAKGEPATAPSNYDPSWERWDSWPGKNLVKLSPRYQDGTLILGGLFRAFREEGLRVTSADGATIYQRDRDFLFNPEWGVIANKDNAMKGPIAVTAQGAWQRLDLLQVNVATGAVSVQKGKSQMVAPELPAPAAGCAGLAGIYIAPWLAAHNPFYDADPAGIQGATAYAITAHEIAAIQPLPVTPPIHPERVAHTLGKLRAAPGTDPKAGEIRIAFMGDSITLGAESTQWYNVKPYGPEDRTYRGTFIRMLRERFPKATITPIEAYKGGAGIELATGQIDQMLTDSHPDLVVIAFGANDMNGPIGGAPHTPLEKFGAQLETLTEKAHTAGADVILVTCFPLNPFVKSKITDRQPPYNAALKAAADAKGAAVADVFTEYSHLGSHGVPPWSTIHNWINHPDDRGHRVYADQLLSFFPAEARGN